MVAIAAVLTGTGVSARRIHMAVILATVAQADLLAVRARSSSFKDIPSVACAVIRVRASVCAVAIVAARMALAVVDITARLTVTGEP